MSIFKIFESALNLITLAPAWSDNCLTAQSNTQMLSARSPGSIQGSSTCCSARTAISSMKTEQLQQSHCSLCAARLGEGRDVAARDSLHGPMEIKTTLPARCFRTAPMSMWKPLLKSAGCNYKTRDVVSLTAGNLLICNLHELFQGSVSRPQNEWLWDI